MKYIEEWKLEQVEPQTWEQDESGVYAVIHRHEIPGVHKGIHGTRIVVRVDIMGPGDEPCQSFEAANAHDLRIRVARYLAELRPPLGVCHISYEHMSYIGAEIQRAFEAAHYVQD